jgi:hypothetical protein
MAPKGYSGPRGELILNKLKPKSSCPAPFKQLLQATCCRCICYRHFPPLFVNISTFSVEQKLGVLESLEGADPGYFDYGYWGEKNADLGVGSDS